ncbi:MAG: ABC transporter permease, partial [Clostridiales bacterium]|nr:ABC transporter permease [Clostridiales bacterium]
MSFDFISLFVAAVLAGTPLLLGTLGEILTEKSGHLNLGVEGMMFMGAVTSLAASYAYEQMMKSAGFAASGFVSLLIALAAAFAAGALCALIYSFLTVTLRADQNVTGLTLTIFGTGLANFCGELLGKRAGGFVTVSKVTKAAFSQLDLFGLKNSASPFLQTISKLFLQYNWMVYFAIVLAIAMAWFFKRSRVGLNLRAVGENPATADAAGINVTRYKYLATIIGGGICGIGGMYMSMVNQSGVWVHNCVAGYGWLAVALVIFSTWSPLRGLICGLIFGAFTIMRLYVNIPGLAMQIYDMLPYAATIFVHHYEHPP